jgi:FkbM family methyltransferase
LIPIKFLNTWISNIEDPLQFSLKYVVKPESVLHCGSHLGQENEIYLSRSVRNIWWLEAQAKICNQLRSKFGNEKVIQGALWSQPDQTIDFHITNNNLSSSIYEIGVNSWNVENISVEKVKTLTLDRVLADLKSSVHITPELVVLDLQGAEYEAILGGKHELPSVRFLLVEVSKSPIYVGAPSFEELKETLNSLEFRSIREFIDPFTGHGEVVFAKEKLEKIKSFRISLAMIIYPYIKKINSFLRRLDKKLDLALGNLKQTDNS